MELGFYIKRYPGHHKNNKQQLECFADLYIAFEKVLLQFKETKH
jgi:hypothetical protein